MWKSTSVCPPWSACKATRDHCVCATDHLRYVRCGTDATKVMSCHCLTYNPRRKEYHLGACFYNCAQGNPSMRGSIYWRVPSDPNTLNQSMCGNLYRDGKLCGQCMSGYSPPVYSYYVDCVQCPDGDRNWWKFALAAFLPLTIFYLVVLLCKVSITPPYLYAFIFYAQAMTTPCAQ